MPKRLIINADDYGRSPEISRGIREAHLRGVVTSTTCMMNIRTTARDIAMALHETPDLKMGIHLVLTAKKPILPRQWVKSITDEDGNFLKPKAFFTDLPNIDILEVKAEWRAQIEAFIAASGEKPSHLDSHHHSSYASSGLFKAMLELAKEYDCPIRYPVPSNGVPTEFAETARHAPTLLQEFDPRRPDHFIAAFYDEGATKENLLDILSKLPDGISELMCHPGYVDQEFAEKESIYNFQRNREVTILTDPAIKQAIKANNIELISFANL
ncbi:MAG: ChbG/HpnK family deacetylase [Chloroflexi bacterium]|nr:ChbG/HpnK family deacetylase [Chloroflexota bacterium]